MAVIIRKAETEKDLKGKAYVHWKSWHEAYAGIIDKSYLDRMTLEKCEEIALKFPDHLLIAEDDGKVIGFVSYGDCRDEDLADTGEVYAIYILEEYYGQGYDEEGAPYEEGYYEDGYDPDQPYDEEGTYTDDGEAYYEEPYAPQNEQNEE